MQTYSEFQNKPSSEKIGLIILEASKRLIGFGLHSGSIYRLDNFDHNVLVSIEDSGTAYASVGDLASVTAGSYYHDRSNKKLYLRASDSSNPNGLFIALTFRLHFSNVAIAAPHDLASGYEVEWIPYLESTSDFGVELDNQNQLGFAIEGSGSITFHNDQEFWAPLFDKVYFENQRCFVYSWNRFLDISEAKIIYRGRIETKSYDPRSVSFKVKDFINELRAPIDLDEIKNVSGVRVPENLLEAKQRRLYGYVLGQVPTPIDQMVEGYPLTGLVSIQNGSTTLTGSGTLFLKEVSPDDEILISNDEEPMTVKSIESNTSLTLTSSYSELTKNDVSATISPKTPVRYANREFLVAGHALREPSTTVTQVVSLSRIRVADPTDFRSGDAVEIAGENSTIVRIMEDVIKLGTTLVTPPSVGTTILRPAITNVYLDKKKLQLNRDYTYNATTGRLTLDELAEFNVAPIRAVSGTVSFTNGSRTITGTNTFFKSDLASKMWIRAEGQFDYFEILQVNSDTEAILRSAATYTVSTSALKKEPDIYNEEESVLSCDALGLSTTGTTGGTLLKRGPEIVKDLLTRGGLGADLDTTSFIDANDLAEHRLGFAIPKKYTDNEEPTIRSVINEINQSIFGSLIQNNTFQLAYNVLEPNRLQGVTKLDHSDVLKFKIESKSDRIAKIVHVKYLMKEYDPVSDDEVFSLTDFESESARFLAKTDRELTVETLLIDASSAAIMAGRWAFLIEVASSVMQLETKLKTALLQVNDRVEIDHEKLYERVGSNLKRKIGGLQLAKRSIFDATIELEDLSNALSRCSTITVNTARDFTDASDAEKLYNGFITDSYGMIANDPETFNIDLIW